MRFSFITLCFLWTYNLHAEPLCPRVALASLKTDVERLDQSLAAAAQDIIPLRLIGPNGERLSVYHAPYADPAALETIVSKATPLYRNVAQFCSAMTCKALNAAHTVASSVALPLSTAGLLYSFYSSYAYSEAKNYPGAFRYLIAGMVALKAGEVFVNYEARMNRWMRASITNWLHPAFSENNFPAFVKSIAMRANTKNEAAVVASLPSYHNLEKEVLAQLPGWKIRVGASEIVETRIENPLGPAIPVQERGLFVLSNDKARLNQLAALGIYPGVYEANRSGQGLMDLSTVINILGLEGPEALRAGQLFKSAAVFRTGSGEEKLSFALLLTDKYQRTRIYFPKGFEPALAKKIVDYLDYQTDTRGVGNLTLQIARQIPHIRAEQYKVYGEAVIEDAIAEVDVNEAVAAFAAP